MIRACRDVRTGEPIADGIHRLGGDNPLDSSERYGDLFVEWSRPTDAIRHPDIGIIGPFPFNRTGAHHERGFAWVSANGLTPGGLTTHSVLDLPPTIVKMIDQDAPLPPAGKPISELIGARESR